MFAPLVAKPTIKSAEPQRSAIAAQRPGQSNRPQENEDPAARSTGREAAPRRDFSTIPVFFSGHAERPQRLPPLSAPRHPARIQAKLKVGAVNDPLEHEADRAADQVMRMPAPEISLARAAPQVSRKCAECEEEKKLHRKAAGPQGAGSEAPALVHEVLRSPGRPLDAATRGFFEARFGHDFSAVRVHTGASAEQSARDIDAHAYTAGHNVVFGAGRFAPTAQEGRRLLAHELAHVVQQSLPGTQTSDAAVQRACLPDAECATPKGEERAGSAKQFAKEMQAQQAPKEAEKRQQTAAVAQASGHGRRAPNVEKLFQEHLPQLWPLVHGVYVDDTLPPDAGASRVNCVAWAANALPATADKKDFEGGPENCITIPKKLETDAGQYLQLVSTGKATAAHKQLLDFSILRPLTHEVTHVRFNKASITFPSKEKLPPDQQKCTNDALRKELSELASCISEFPVVAGLDPDFRDLWAKQYLTDRRKEASPGESIFGSIHEIRCSCACEDADKLIKAAFDIASALWTEKQKLEFHAYMKRGEGKKYAVYWPYEVPLRTGGVGPHALSIDLGVGFSGSSKLAVAMLSYNYVLSQWADGRLRLTAGAQANPGALLTSPLHGEFGAVTAGLQYVSTPRAVESTFGGFTGRVNTGFGAGEFLLTPASPGGAERTGVRADYVLRVGAGVQFFIPGLTSLTPVSLEAAYGLAQPLDSDAKRIHTVGLTFSLPLGQEKKKKKKN